MDTAIEHSPRRALAFPARKLDTAGCLVRPAASVDWARMMADQLVRLCDTQAVQVALVSFDGYSPVSNLSTALLFRFYVRNKSH